MVLYLALALESHHFIHNFHSFSVTDAFGYDIVLSCDCNKHIHICHDFL